MLPPAQTRIHSRTARVAVLTFALSVAGALLASQVMAVADKPADKTAFKRAAAHFKAGEYAQAAPLFHIAYTANAKPVLLFNAALSEQRADQLEAAARDYRRVLKLKDVHPKIMARTRKELALVEATLATRKPSLPAPQPVKGAPETPTTVRKDAAGWQGPAGWAGVGVGAALVGVGGWLLTGVAAEQAELDDLTAQQDGGKVKGISYEEYHRRDQDNASNEALGIVSLATGLCAVGGGAWLLLSQPDSTALHLRPHGRGLALRVSF